GEAISFQLLAIQLFRFCQNRGLRTFEIRRGRASRCTEERPQPLSARSTKEQNVCILFASFPKLTAVFFQWGSHDYIAQEFSTLVRRWYSRWGSSALATDRSFASSQLRALQTRAG